MPTPLPLDQRAQSGPFLFIHDQTIFSITEIPYREFEILGMSKKAVLSFPPLTLVVLLSGNRTSLIRFKKVSIRTSDNKLTLDGKLSLRKTSDEKLHLNFHPVNTSPKNAFGLDNFVMIEHC